MRRKERFKLPPRRTNRDPLVLVGLWLNSQGVLSFHFFYNVLSFIFFYRETDDVRMASSLASWHDYPIPYDVHRLPYPRLHAIMGTCLAHECEQTGIAATIIDRAIAAIATVKAFNAAEMESQRANASFLQLKKAARKLDRVWGTTSGIAQFVMMVMFV